MPIVHNRGKKHGDKTIARKIIYPSAWDENGLPAREGKVLLTDSIEPGAHKTLTQAQYDHLKELFPNEIVNLDDIRDMQQQFQPSAPPKPREGYLAPDEVDALVEKRVAEKLAANLQAAPKELDQEKSLAVQISGMDRAELIALIETEELEIEAKNYKAPNSLKAAILTAIENKKAAVSEM